MRTAAIILALSCAIAVAQFLPLASQPKATKPVAVDNPWPDAVFVSILSTGRLDVTETLQSYEVTIPAGPWPCLAVNMGWYSDFQQVLGVTIGGQTMRGVTQEGWVGQDRGSNAWWVLPNPPTGTVELGVYVSDNGFIDYMSLHALVFTNIHQVDPVGGSQAYTSGAGTVTSSSLTLAGETQGYAVDSIIYFRNESDTITNTEAHQVVYWVSQNNGNDSLSSKVSVAPMSGGAPITMGWDTFNDNVTHVGFTLRRR